MSNTQFLMKIDPTIPRNIAGALKCHEDDINHIVMLTKGLTNVTFAFDVPAGRFVYRHPGSGTKDIINRHSEEYSERIALGLNLDTSFITMDAQCGWKVSKYIEDYQYINPTNEKDRKLAMQTVKFLHDQKIHSPFDFDYYQQTIKLNKLLFKDSIMDKLSFEILNSVKSINDYIQSKGCEKVLCHNDCWAWNMLKTNDNDITLIDWEYSGNSFAAADVAYFTGSYQSDDEDYLDLAELYEKHTLNKLDKKYYFGVLAIVFWYWYTWALYKEAHGSSIADKSLWYDKAIHAIDRFGEL